LRSAPFACIGIVAAASAAAHYGNATDAIGRATISRWRALGLLNGILTYCTARPWHFKKPGFAWIQLVEIA
jgi:hypothetical protein